MSWNRFIFKSHKWLAVAVGLLTLLWFVSGIVMATPASWFGAPQPIPVGEADGASFRDVAVTVPQAIDAVERTVGHSVDVSSVGFRRTSGLLLYEISTKQDGTHLVDALRGELFVVDPAVVQGLVMRAMPGVHSSEPATLIREHDRDYRFGPLPAWRVPLKDPNETIFYVATSTGEMRATNRGGRLRGLIAGLHTFNFLHGAMSNRGVRVTLILTSVVGTLMSLFGLAILWIQFVNWRERRRAPRNT